MLLQIVRVAFKGKGGVATYRVVDAVSESISLAEGRASFNVIAGGPPEQGPNTEVVTVRGDGQVVVVIRIAPPKRLTEGTNPERYRRPLALLLANMVVSSRLRLGRTAPTVVLPPGGNWYGAGQ